MQDQVNRCKHRAVRRDERAGERRGRLDRVLSAISLRPFSDSIVTLSDIYHLIRLVTLTIPHDGVMIHVTLWVDLAMLPVSGPRPGGDR
jgi:hypothetical protein